MSCTALLWSGVVDLSFPNKSAFLNVCQCALLLFGATPDRPGQFSGSPRISTVFATRWAMPLPDCSAQGRRCRSVDHEVELLLHPEPRLRDRKGSQENARSCPPPKGDRSHVMWFSAPEHNAQCRSVGPGHVMWVWWWRRAGCTSGVRAPR